MSAMTAMTDSFVPLVTTRTSAVEAPTFQLKVLPQAEAKPVFEPLPEVGGPSQPSKPCARPSVTLQRQGDVISGIRIECGCGQVFELACTY